MRQLFAAALAIAFIAPCGAMAQERTLNLINHARQPIVGLTVSPQRAGTWSADVLGAQVAPNAAPAVVHFSPERGQCLFDLRISYDGGAVSELNGIDLCEARSITVTDGDDDGDQEEDILTG